jgi:hypothetical protein
MLVVIAAIATCFDEWKAYWQGQPTSIFSLSLHECVWYWMHTDLVQDLEQEVEAGGLRACVAFKSVLASIPIDEVWVSKHTKADGQQLSEAAKMPPWGTLLPRKTIMHLFNLTLNVLARSMYGAFLAFHGLCLPCLRVCIYKTSQSKRIFAMPCAHDYMQTSQEIADAGLRTFETRH